MTTLILLLSLSAYARPDAETRRFYSSLSCPTLDSLLIQKSLKQTHHVEWMSANCAGDRELTVPVCKSMSSELLRELDEISEVERVIIRKCGGLDEP